MTTVPITSAINVSNGNGFVLFGGVNVLESKDMALRAAEEYVRFTKKLGIPYVWTFYSYRLMKKVTGNLPVIFDVTHARHLLSQPIHRR